MTEASTIISIKPCKHGHTGGRTASGVCKECQRASQAAYNAANKEKLAAYQAAYSAANKEKKAAYTAANKEKIVAQGAARYAANKDQKAAYMVAYQAANKEKLAAYRAANKDKTAATRWKKLGYPTPTRPQTLVCDICGKANKSKQSMALDHCHTTDIFRGWLCSPCNLSIGALGDSTSTLRKALHYLERAYHAT